MAMIPRGAERRGLEFVCFGMPWCYGTFGDATNTIFTVVSRLAETMPVNAGSVVLKFVDDGDLKYIAPVGLDQRPGKLTIDYQHLLGNTNRRQGSVLNPQCPFAGDTCIWPFRVGVSVDVVS